MRHTSLEELYNTLDHLLESKDRVLIAIDGYSGSGKSSLAEMIQQRTDCNLFHMDDFFLQEYQRTPKRLLEPGGNVDYERFLEEVLIPYRKAGLLSIIFSTAKEWLLPIQ
jgi:shikimate kinase